MHACIFPSLRPIKPTDVSTPPTHMEEEIVEVRTPGQSPGFTKPTLGTLKNQTS